MKKGNLSFWITMVSAILLFFSCTTSLEERKPEDKSNQNQQNEQKQQQQEEQQQQPKQETPEQVTILQQLIILMRFLQRQRSPLVITI